MFKYLLTPSILEGLLRPNYRIHTLMLSALLLIPIIGSLVLLPMNEESQTGVTRMKQLALATSMVNFILSIVLWGEFDSSSVQYQFVQEFNTLKFLSP